MTIDDYFLQQDSHVSDKWSGYLPIYERYLSGFEKQPINLLEIGIQNGGSLDVWARYFQSAKQIVGCDINPKCEELKFADSRIAVVVGDVNLAQTRASIHAKAPAFEVIIDDGSHTSVDVIHTFKTLYPKLKPGGVYLIEDLHCSYWAKFGGGLWRKDSAIEFFKQLVDVLNYESWGVEVPNNKIITRVKNNKALKIKLEVFRTIESIHFYNSVCVILKGHEAENTIGRRVVVGADAAVYDRLPASGSTLPVSPQARNARRLGIRLKSAVRKRIP